MNSIVCFMAKSMKGVFILRTVMRTTKPGLRTLANCDEQASKTPNSKNVNANGTLSFTQATLFPRGPVRASPLGSGPRSRDVLLVV